MSTLYDTDFGAWLEAQLHALATGAWTELDIPHLCDELDDVRRHYLHELEWTLTTADRGPPGLGLCARRALRLVARTHERAAQPPEDLP